MFPDRYLTSHGGRDHLRGPFCRGFLKRSLRSMVCVSCDRYLTSYLVWWTTSTFELRMVDTSSSRSSHFVSGGSIVRRASCFVFLDRYLTSDFGLSWWAISMAHTSHVAVAQGPGRGPGRESSPCSPGSLQNKSQGPGKEGPEGQKERFTPKGGTNTAEGFPPWV